MGRHYGQGGADGAQQGVVQGQGRRGHAQGALQALAFALGYQYCCMYSAHALAWLLPAPCLLVDLRVSM